MAKSPNAVPLSELTNNQEAIVFAALSAKAAGQTKDGKPYYRATFRDARREATAMIWHDSPFYESCEKSWKIGDFYKIAVLYRESDYGPKLEIRRIRAAVEADAGDGFSPNQCRPTTAIEPALLMDEILALAKARIGKGPLLLLIQRVFKEKRQRLLDTASSRERHHNVFGGMLEHTLSVTKIAAFLIDHFLATYPTAKKDRPDFSPALTIAGAVLHEVGKIAEMEAGPLIPKRSLAGELIGYPVLGRDIIREYGPMVELPPATQLALEHIILSHPRFPDWGAVGVPMSLEAMIVHLADYADSIFAATHKTLGLDRSDEAFTFAKGPFGAVMLK